MKYMLDTNVCISLIRRQPPNVLRRLTACVPGDVCISSLILAELAYGAQKSSLAEKNMAALEQFTLPLEIADFDQNAALAYGLIRAILEREGKVIGSMDMLIGAHALSLGLILVTNNTKEFKCIPNLSIEDWLAE